MPSSRFRTLTGAIVTVLVMALVLLIVSTLVRYPMETPGAAAGDQPVTPHTAQSAAPDEAATPLPDAAAAETPAGDAENTDPQIAITIQPTPTRRAGDPAPAAEATTPPTAEEPPAGVLPRPDSAAAPAAPLLVYANANWVNDLVFVGESLWAATSGGAIRWDVNRAQSQSFSVADGLRNTQLSAAIHCPIGDFDLLFGSAAGLQLFDQAELSWAQLAAGEESLRSNDVSALACDEENGLLAVGYATQGVDLFRERTERWSYTALPASVGQGVQALAFGADGELWAASGGALLQILGTRMTAITASDSPLTGETITALSVDDEGALWVTAGDRLYRKQGETWDVFEERRAAGDFPAGELADVQPASAGRVWLAGEAGDICRFDRELESCTPWYSAAAEESTGMAAGPVTALAVAPNGALAYGTDGQGVSLFARSRWSTLALDTPFPAGNRIHALVTDAQGFVWNATNLGVQQFDPGNPASSYLYTSAADGVSATNVRALFADAAGGVWLGGIGASYFDGRRWTNFTQADGLAGDEITAIAQDSQGRVWFGTRTGLSIWTGTTFFNLTGENGLPDSEILSLAAEGESMWIGSAAGGLYRFERNQLQVLTQENVDLPSNRITALLVTADGTLLAGTDAGLAQFRDGQVQRLESLSEERITALARGLNGELWVGTAGDGTWQSLDGSEWVQSSPEQGGVPSAVRALAVDQWNGLWIGSDGGLVRLAP